jgi:hypothetical protein
MIGSKNQMDAEVGGQAEGTLTGMMNREQNAGNRTRRIYKFMMDTEDDSAFQFNNRR